MDMFRLPKKEMVQPSQKQQNQAEQNVAEIRTHQKKTMADENPVDYGS